MSYSLFYNFTSALVLGPACPAGSRPVAALRPLARAPRPAAPGRPAKPVQAPCRASYDRVYWFAAAPKPPPAAAFLDSRLLSVAPTTSFGKLARAASAMRLSSGL